MALSFALGTRAFLGSFIHWRAPIPLIYFSRETGRMCFFLFFFFAFFLFFFCFRFPYFFFFFIIFFFVWLFMERFKNSIQFR